jgi:hypothetical protein
VPSPNTRFVAVAAGSWHSLGIRGTSTPVEGAFFATLSGPDVVTLRWSLDSFSEITGFNVYRATSRLGAVGPETPFARINGNPLPPSSPSSYDDTTIWPGTTFWYELRALLANGDEDAVSGGPVSVVVPGELRVALSPPIPNPSNGSIELSLAVPHGAGAAHLAVYDVSGRLVRVLLDGHLAGGRHPMVWDATEQDGHRVASGVYFVRLEVDGAVATRKLTLLR